MDSKYIQKIQDGLTAAGEGAKIIGSTLLVEIVKRERKTSSGIITSISDKPTGKELFELIVVATGSGYFNEDSGEDIPLDTKVGDVIYVDPHHVRQLYDFPVEDYSPNSLALVEEAQVLLRFRGKEAVDGFRRGVGIGV